MKRIKTQKLKNNQICLSHKWINNVVNNVVNENEKYKCTIVKENDIDLINFINKNDKMIRIKEIMDVTVPLIILKCIILY